MTQVIVEDRKRDIRNRFYMVLIAAYQTKELMSHSMGVRKDKDTVTALRQIVDNNLNIRKIEEMMIEKQRKFSDKINYEKFGKSKYKEKNSRISYNVNDKKQSHYVNSEDNMMAIFNVENEMYEDVNMGIETEITSQTNKIVMNNTSANVVEEIKKIKAKAPATTKVKVKAKKIGLNVGEVMETELDYYNNTNIFNKTQMKVNASNMSTDDAGQDVDKNIREDNMQNIKGSKKEARHHIVSNSKFKDDGGSKKNIVNDIIVSYEDI